MEIGGHAARAAPAEQHILRLVQAERAAELLEGCCEDPMAARVYLVPVDDEGFVPVPAEGVTICDQ